VTYFLAQKQFRLDTAGVDPVFAAGIRPKVKCTAGHT